MIVGGYVLHLYCDSENHSELDIVEQKQCG